MFDKIKNTLGFFKKQKEAKYEIGELVYTHFPKKYFPNLYTGRIVKIKFLEELTKQEIEQANLDIIPNKDPVYVVLCGNEIKIIPEILLKKHVQTKTI